MSSTTSRLESVWRPPYLPTTIGTFSLIAFVAFEAMAVATIMPGVARELDGEGLYALTFAAPLASGVVGMVAAGAWSDRRGPRMPLIASMILFSVGLLWCGLAPTMEWLVVGRLVQGLGGGALIVAVYVLVGLVFPGPLRPAVFASFAAAWVLPALFGPGVAAWVAHVASWRWVFSGAVIFVGLAALLVAPALASQEASRSGESKDDAPDAAPTISTRAALGWALVAAIAVLALELLGSSEDASRLAGAGLALVLVMVALSRVTPRRTLAAGRGLPATIATRGLLSATFFSTEAYIVYVLQEQWGLSAGQAGIALTCVGIIWAVASQAQARLGERISNPRAMAIGSAVVLGGVTVVALTVRLDGHPLVAAAAYVVAGAGMGFAYPRTGVAMLEQSTDSDRGFNSSALSIADSLGGAIALSTAGATFAATQRTDANPFAAVFALSAALGIITVIAAVRTRPARPG